MKKVLLRMLLAVALMLPWAMQAQELSSYTFSTGTDASKWIPISSTTSLITPGAGDYGVSTVQSIGFSFPFGEDVYTQYSVNADGNIRFGATVTGTSNYATPFSSSNANANNPKINMLGCDGFLSDSGYVYAEVVGTAPERVLVIEFATSTYSTTSRPSLLRYQVQLSENGTITVVYSSQVPPILPAVTYQPGLCVNATDGWTIDANHGATAFTNGTSATNASGTWPNPGRYYTFTPPVAASCSRPGAITATTISTDFIDLTWGASDNATQYIVEYADSVFNPGMGEANTDTVSTNAYTLTNLEPNTTYYVTVRALCSLGDTTSPRTAAVRTSCVAISASDLPYVQNFNSLSTGATAEFDPCWTKGTNNTSTSYPYVSATSITPDGGNSLYFYSYHPSSATTTAYYSYAALPSVDANDVDITDLMLSFTARRYGTATMYYTSYLVIGVMTDPNDLSTFVGVDTIDMQALPANTVMNFDIALDQYAGTGTFVALYAPVPPLYSTGTYSYNYVYVDDVVLHNAPTCFRPTAVRKQGATGESITLSWTPDRHDDSYNYTIEYDTTGFTLGEGLTVTISGDTTYTFDNLEAITEYQFFIYADCGGDMSDYRAFSARTECASIAEADLPYTYGFEECTASSTATIDSCWKKYTNNSSTAYPYPSSTTPHTGSRCLYFYSTTAYYSYVVLPTFETELSQLQLSFYNRSSSTSYTGRLLVGYMTNPDDYSTFHQVASCTPNGTTWTLQEVVFPNAPDTARYIAIVCDQHDASTTYAYLDDITVRMAPSCPHIENLALDMVTATNAIISWDSSAMGMFDNAVIEIKEVSETDYTVVDNTSELGYTLTGLNPGTTYSVRVAAVCGSDLSDYEYLTLSTVGFSCSEADTTTFHFDTIGGGSAATDYYIPVNNYYNNSFTEQLVLSNEMNGGGLITSIGFQYSTSYGMTVKNNCQIYLGTTNLNSLSTSNYVNPANMTLVYSGSLNCNSGWNMFNFDTAFFYDGRSNLVVAVIDNNGDYDGSDYEFNVHATAGKVVTFYSDTYNYSQLSSMSSSVRANRNNMVFRVSGCATPGTCAAPAGHVVAVTGDTIAVEWIAGADETSWHLFLGANGAQPTYVASTTETSYAFAGLNPNTHYTVRVMSDCMDSLYFEVAARTSCAPMAVPYVEDFELSAVTTSTNVGDFVSCWEHVNNATTYFGYPFISGTASGAHSGGHSLYWYLSTTANTYGDYEIVALPEFATAIDSLMISFWAKASSATYTPVFHIGVMTDPTDTSTYTHISTVTHTEGTTYARYEIPLSSYTGNGGRIVIRANRPNSVWYAYMDDITVDLIPECETPTNLVAQYVGSDSLILTWHGSSSSYLVDYTAGQEVVADTFVVLTNLTPNTLYPVSVVALCGNDTSNAVYGTFRTACGLLTTLPYEDSFEGHASGSSTNANFVPCWTRLNNGTSYFGYPYVSNSTSYAHSGGAGLYWLCSITANTYGDYQVIALPELDPSIDASTLTLTFWTKASSASYNPVFKVGVMTNADSIDSFVGVDTISFTGTEWRKIEVPLANYTGNGSFVAIKADRPTGTSWYAYVDDIKLDYTPSCLKPRNVHATSIGLDSVTLVWDDLSNAGQYVVEYGPAGFMPGTGTSMSVYGTPSVAIGGLTIATAYDVYIRSICSATDSSILSEVFSFSTLRVLPVSSYPYYCDFSDSTIYNTWTLVNGSQTNQWYIGSAASNNTPNALYITNDNGASNMYAVNSTSVCYAYRDFNLTAGSYDYSYDWIGFGEGSIDYMRVALAPAGIDFTPGTIYSGISATTLPAGWISLDNNSKLNLSSVWGTESGAANIPTTGTYRLVVFWRCDGSLGTQPPAAIDNIFLGVITCPQVQNLTAAVGTSDIQVSWTDANPGMGWEVAYGAHNATPTVVYTTTTSYTIPQYTPNTNYDIRVRHICAVGDTSRWTYVSVLTPNEVISLPVSLDFEDATTYNKVALLNGTNTNAWTIGAAANCDSTNAAGHALYISNDNGTTNSYAIASASVSFATIDVVLDSGMMYYNFDWKCQGEGSYDYLRVAVVPLTVTLTPGTTLPTGYSTTALPASWMALDGGSKLNLHSDWQHVNDSILIPAAGAYHIVFGWRNDGSVGTQPAATIDNINIWDNGAHCQAPHLAGVTSLDFANATINWSSNASDFEVALMNGGVWGAETAVSNAYSYTFTNLQPATTYQYRVRAICDAAEGLISDWAMGSFTTDSLPCFAPTDLIATDVQGQNATLTWTAGSNETAWNLHVFNNTTDLTFNANATTYTVTGLTAGVTYYAAVSAICGGGLEFSDWSDTIEFTTVVCDPVTNVTASGVTNNSAIISWTAGANNTGSWEVAWNYHGAGMTQPLGSQVVQATSFTINGLSAETPYDVAVRAICGDNYNSTYAETQFTTLAGQGIARVDDGLNVSIFPNPASGNTTITLSGVSGSVTLTVVDMSGRTVKTATVECNGDCEKKLDVNGLAAGAYFVRVAGENVNTVKKLIVK